MVYAVQYYDEIRLWWDPRNDKKEGMHYRVYVDGKACVYTDYVYYNFKNMAAGKEYEFEVQLVDERKNLVGKTEFYRVSTFPARETVDITKPPYNAVGDAVTDNTEVIRRALADCKEGKILYFPMGVYLCEKVSFTGDLHVRFDAGAVLCTPQRGKTL